MSAPSLPVAKDAAAPVLRPRLLARLADPSVAPITLIVAPAGYGKSTLATQWAQASGHAIAWLALGPECNHLGRFLHRLARALPGDHAGEEPTPDSLLAALADRPATSPPLTIVLDDVHLIENSDVLEALDALVRALPGGVHILLLSRAQLPLRLARLRALGKVREIGASDLSFTEEETSRLVAQEPARPLTADQTARLAARTEGWIIGIRLALLLLDHHDGDAESVLESLPRHHWLDDYIVEEVLAALPEALQTFVLQTAMLPWLEPALCDHVLGISHSAVLIDEVRQRLVFVRTTDPSSGLMAYHHLFAEIAARIGERRFPADDRRRWHLRAAAWFECREEWESAIDQALYAEAWDVAMRCIRMICRDFTLTERHFSSLYWLRKLPETKLLENPDLARWYITALQYCGLVRDAKRAFAQVEPVWTHFPDPIIQGHLAWKRACFATLDADPVETLPHVYRALHHFPLAEAAARLHTWTIVMQLEFERGNHGLAREAYRQAQRCRERLPSPHVWGSLQLEIARASHLALGGELAAADEMYQTILAQLPAAQQSQAARIRARLAMLYLERNDLDAAAAEAVRIDRELVSASPLVWHPDAALAAVQVAAARGGPAAATVALQRVREGYASWGITTIQRMTDAFQASLWLEAGEIALAREWAAQEALHEKPWRHAAVGDVDPRQVLVRVQIALGECDAALVTLQRLVEQSRQSRRTADLVGFHVWQMAAHLAAGDQPAALAALRGALRHGMPGGFARTFHPPGVEVRAFYTWAQRRLPAGKAAYLHAIVDAAGPGEPVAGAPPSATQPLPSLTPREREVLPLLSEGCSNREIAGRLFITERTAKKHVLNLLAKLGVPNRTAVVVRARELGLLP